MKHLLWAVSPGARGSLFELCIQGDLICISTLSSASRGHHSNHGHSSYVGDSSVQNDYYSSSTAYYRSNYPTMCQTKFWSSPTCQHDWVTLGSACAEGRNFNTCPRFHNGRFRNARELRAMAAEPKSCPACDKGNNYVGLAMFILLFDSLILYRTVRDVINTI